MGQFCGVLWCVLLGSDGSATLFAEAPIDYLLQVKPVLQARCYACHGALKQEAGLRLDTAALIRQGTNTGTLVIDLQQVATSQLLARVTASDEAERMPPEGEPLKPIEIAALRGWIEQGATGPTEEMPERDPAGHWAFQPPVRPAVPVVRETLWNANPIDAFLMAEQERLGVSHQPVADKRIWLRRVTVDLIGLPPTLQEQEQFLADESDAAYVRVVDRLLSSPQYGERWGRHWMDIWRYSDWWGLGAEVRNSQKHLWHWRDWIVESLNADQGYDQMVREMLAADELYPDDMNRLRASGFLARQYFKFNRTTWLDGAMEHTSKAFLGLTLNCAKCHDHKYDPISQQDYYRFRAIFEPYQVRTDLLPGELDLERDGLPRAFDCNLEIETFLHIRGDDRNPESTRLAPGVPAVLANSAWQVEPVTLTPEAWQPGLRPHVVDGYVQAAERDLIAARANLEIARKQLGAAEQLALAAVPRSETEGDEPLVTDDFSVEKDDLWEQLDGDWEYRDGKLMQSRIGSSRAALRLRLPPPQDFEATLKFVPTGGEQWKSVGITFDVTDAGNEVLAYVSAYAAGAKSQVSYKEQGNHVYPAQGAQARRVALHEPHELTLRVRGTLVNVIVDGEHSVAYRLPIARQPGALELIAFDAAVEFVSFTLRDLPGDMPLVEAAGTTQPDQPLPLEQAKLAVIVAEQAVVTRAANKESLIARAAADHARYLEPERKDITDLRAAAAQAHAVAGEAAAQEQVRRLEFAVLQASVEQQAAAKQKLTAAETELAAAQKTLAAPGEDYPPLAGALKTLESNLETEESRRKPFPSTSTGRRRALANWLTDRQHPLLARVAVNHIWSRHFGRPLVPTVFDFGRKGIPPTHPELLDWLAVELMEHNWSMQHIHRLITTSQAYRLTSSTLGATAVTLKQDPENRSYWRTNPIRIEAQVVRDSLLSLAGELDLKMGGPSIPVTETNSRRRSLYYVHSHNEHQQFLSMFDDANVLECYRRAESIVPQQALALENSELAVTMAAKIAAKIAGQRTADGTNAADEDFIRQAFLTVLCCEPQPEELAVVRAALVQFTNLAQQRQLADPGQHARTQLVHALLNHNDFVTIR